MHADHSGAGAGWHNHIVKCFKFGDEFKSQCLGGFLVSRVVTGLAATGLLYWKLDLAACGFQQLDGGKPYARAYGVNQASDEQSNAHCNSPIDFYEENLPD